MDYPAARIYISDNIGDICRWRPVLFCPGFSGKPVWQLCFWPTCHCWCRAICFLLPRAETHPGVIVPSSWRCRVLGGGIGLENIVSGTRRRPSWFSIATPHTAELPSIRTEEQFTLFENGMPTFSNQNLSMAEETIHYPLSQLDVVQHVLLISAEGGVMARAGKISHSIRRLRGTGSRGCRRAISFRPDQKDQGVKTYPSGWPGLSCLNREKTYDAIIVNLPEPNTFQFNRFYTDGFFDMASKHLVKMVC